MADQDTPVVDTSNEDEAPVVETVKTEDEQEVVDPLKPVDTETGDEIKEEDESEGIKPETDEDAPKFQKRFTQFQGDTPEEYIKNLETAHANALTEGQRKTLEAKKTQERFDQVAKLVATDPDFAAKLAAATGDEAPKVVVDPAVEYARSQMETEYAKDYSTFVDSHPSLATDTDKQEAVIQELDIIAAANEKRGVRLSMAEGLRRAWISLGYDKDESKDDLVDKVKDQASKPQAPAKVKSPSKKSDFTEEQIAVAKKMGLTPETLAEYNK